MHVDYKYLNRRTSHSGERQRVGRKGNKALGKKIYKCKKKLSLYLKKQNKTTKTKKKILNEKKRMGKGKETVVPGIELKSSYAPGNIVSSTRCGNIPQIG